MSLPERAKPYLDLLERFLLDPAVTPFGRAAREEFFGEERPVMETEEPKDFLDYAQFTHRDGQGQCLADHLLAQRGGTMSPEERDVFAGFSRSEYGIFLVETVQPGEGMTLRRSGTDERFEVVEAEASRALKPGMGVIARLVPYRGRHEITGVLRAVSPEAAYVSDRAARRQGDEAAKDLSNPLTIRKILGDVGKKPAPPESQLEAEIQAAAVFAEVKVPLTVEEIQSRFQAEGSALELLRNLPQIQLEGEQAIERFIDALTHLWNFTPRDDLGGLSPAEKYTRRGTSDIPELPAADSPVWTRERLQSLLGSPRSASRRWALQWIASHAGSAGGFDLVDTVASLLADENEDVVDDTLSAVARLRDSPQSAEIAAWIRDRLPNLGEVGSPLHAKALRALGRLQPSESFDVFIETLQADAAESHPAAAAGIVAARREGAGDALYRFIAEGATEVRSAIVALAGLCRLREADLVAAAATKLLIECYDPKREALDVDDVIVDLEHDIAGVSNLFCAVETALFPDEDDPLTGQERLAVFRPAEDPTADRRGREILDAGRSEKIIELIEAHDLSELVVLFSNLAVEAFERASAESSSFAPLGRTLAGIAASFHSRELLKELSSENLEAVVRLAGTLLAKAIRGRDISRELEAAEDDRDKLLALCRVDEIWLTEELIPRVAGALCEEDLLPLAESPDTMVRQTSRILLGAIAPAKWLVPAREAFASVDDNVDSLFKGVLRTTGDKALEPLLEAARQNPDDGSPRSLLLALQILGTERARVGLDRSLQDFFGLEAPSLEIVRAALACGSPELARKVVEHIREGTADLNEARGFGFTSDDILLDLEALIDLAGLDESAEEILVEGETKFTSSGRQRAVEDSDDSDPFGDDDTEDDDDDTDDNSLWHTDDEPYRPIEPIVREAPKIGRNAPCPCGSGKKYKKCCGK